MSFAVCNRLLCKCGREYVRTSRVRSLILGFRVCAAASGQTRRDGVLLVALVEGPHRTCWRHTIYGDGRNNVVYILMHYTRRRPSVLGIYRAHVERLSSFKGQMTYITYINIYNYR